MIMTLNFEVRVKWFKPMLDHPKAECDPPPCNMMEKCAQ